MADEVDALGVDRSLRAYFINERIDIGNNIDFLAVSVATRFRGVPKSLTFGVGHAVGCDIDDAVLLSDRAKVHVILLVRT